MIFVLTFNLKTKFYNMIVEGNKTSEYRIAKDYWHTRLGNLKIGDTIKFVKGY